MSILQPEDTLLIGMFCGFMSGYALGTLMWFRRTPRPATTDASPKGDGK